MTARRFFEKLEALYTDEQERLNDLDAAIGDGDHGSTMLRGLTAAAKAGDGLQAKAFMRASGGASGTLFGLILHEIELHLSGSERSLAAHLRRSLERIKELGKVAQGDKSMVDSLEPAVSALDAGRGIGAAVAAATAGREATRDLAARRGRARYVEDAGRGHVDPGAASVCLILGVLAGEEEQR
ncbi:DAK2 domain-containing protein [Nitratireductor sp. XY-223]|uniref:DAK2 domain-containing protein n=1 Tax=Nitratireductor sp. XY-223 TaxID=2561926 RepID=UPI0010AAA5A3|nr:DAK2 domain-containing protein [Nitratireductor sp. XY-223]